MKKTEVLRCDEILVALDAAYTIVGNFNLGIPYIRMEFDAQIQQILRHDARVRDEERAYCATFLHEYIHFLQSVLFRSCQLQAIVWQNLIFDIHETAMQHKGCGNMTLLPLSFSDDTVGWMQRTNAVFNHSLNVRLANGLDHKFGIVDVAEGIARILEEQYLGKRICESQPPYTTIHDINLQIFGHDNKLSNAELLDVAEVALSYEYPDEMFLRLCNEIKKAGVRGDGFYKNIEALAKACGHAQESSLAGVIAKNVRGLFTSNIFSGYSETMQRLYGDMPKLLRARPLFSVLYKQLGSDDGNGMPECILQIIHDWGDCTPLIVNKQGELEQFSRTPNYYYEQHALVIESVIRCIAARQWGTEYEGCSMIKSCQNACSMGIYLPVNDICKSDPWVKKLVKKDFCCPFGAVRRAFGLEDLLLC